MTISPDVLTVARSVRTSDIADALDSLGLQERHQMDPRMRPLYPGIRFAGIAHPMAYDLLDRPLEPMTYEEFSRRQYASGPEGLWREAGPWGAPDEVLVIDAKGTAAGTLGSANTLGGRARGTVSFVIDGACRDSHECEIGADVVDRARRIQEADRPGRREGYVKLGLPLDETVA